MDTRLHDVLNATSDNYILPFYWMRGESKELLLEGMQRIYDCGIRAVCLEARPHPDFVGEKWWHDFDIILKRAKELGMKIWILDDSHFPTGRCNDTITPDSPYRKFALTHYCIDISGPMKDASFIVDLDKNETFVAAIAGKRDVSDPYRLTNVIDITHTRKGNFLEFDIPDGFWTVVIIKVTDKNVGRPHYANLIDRNAVKYLIDTVYEPHFSRYGAEFGTVIAGFFSDEPELGNAFRELTRPGEAHIGNPAIVLPWCDELENELKKLWGNQYAVNLSRLWLNLKEEDCDNKTRMIRKQYMDILTLMYKRNFSEQLGDWCRSHNVAYIGHVIEEGSLGRGVGHFFRGTWGQDMAGIDVVLQSVRPQYDTIPFYRSFGQSQRVIGGTDFSHYALGRLCSSLSHADPKKKGRAMCEIFGAYGWVAGVKLMKWLLDHMLVRGINYFVPHAFSMRDFPDSDCPPHFYARGNNPQYDAFKLLMKYANRMSHILSGGLHCPDVAVLYNTDLDWFNTENMKFTEPCKVLAQNTIDYDILPFDILYNSKIENEKLIYGGETHENGHFIGQEGVSTLIIPACVYIEEEFAKWCEYALKKGFKIIFINNKPQIIDEDGRIYNWKENVCVVMMNNLTSELDHSGLEKEIRSTSKYLRVYKYQHQQGKYYILFNESIHEKASIRTSFQLANHSAVYDYDAWFNKLSKLSSYAFSQDMEIEVNPYQMKVLYIGDDNENCNIVTTTDHLSEMTLPNISWQVNLKNSVDKTELTLNNVHKLKNITSSEMYPDFSGIMTYKTELLYDWTDNWKFLDLGDVFETARLIVNGNDIGTLITPPYRFDISNCMKHGKNEVIIEVTNTLVHRVRDNFSVGMPVEPSGLMGPITIFK